MFMKSPFLTLISATALLASGPSAHAAGILLTYAEAPGVQSSTLANTNEFTFDSLAPGKHTNVVWTGVGTYDETYILAPDQYGGAGGNTTYSVQSSTIGHPNQVPTTTLTLNTASAYFGLWWSAGDNFNKLSFYNGTNLVGEFTTSTLVSVLPSSYAGNPNASFLGQNSNENYAFFNVYGQGGSTFDKIVFTNAAATGFESDNHTVRAGAWGTEAGESGPEPGVPVALIDGTTVTPIAAVPETTTWVMGFLALGAAGFLARRKGLV